MYTYGLKSKPETGFKNVGQKRTCEFLSEAGPGPNPGPKWFGPSLAFDESSLKNGPRFRPRFPGSTHLQFLKLKAL